MSIKDRQSRCNKDKKNLILQTEDNLRHSTTFNQASVLGPSPGEIHVSTINHIYFRNFCVGKIK